MAITAAELLVKVSADTSGAESGLKSFSGKMNNMAGGMAAVGGVLSATIAAPLIGIGVTAVKTAADFERSMNVLAYSSGASADQMQTMSDLALKLGADTVFSANEAADGMVELSKAGMDTQDVMDSISGVMDLAAAGAISVSDAATLASATLNTFGLAASESGKVADVLAAAANASAADISDLAFGVQNAGSIFATSGQSVETLATMMALLANNGLNASDAATSLKTMTMRLTAPTAAAAKEMKKLGINVFNADGSMRDYHDIIGDLSRSTLGLSDAQRSAAFSAIFGADAIRAANIMAKEGTAGYEAMAAAVTQQGAASEMANAQNSGLAGAMEQISGSIESLMTKLALPFLDTISGWMGGLTEFVNQLGDLPQPVINAALAFAGFAAAIGLALVAAAGIAGVVGALATPIGLVVLAVIGLGAAVAGLWLAWQTNWMNIQGLTASAMAVINPLLATLSANVSAAATALSNFKMPTLADLDTLKSDIKFQINATVETLLNPPKLTIAPFPPMTIDPPKVTIDPIGAGVGTLAGKGVSTMIENLTQTIAGGDWAGVGRLMGTMIIASWNTEMAKIEPFLTFIGVASTIGTALQLFQGQMVGALLGFVAALSGTGVPGQIAELGTTIAKAFTDMWTNLIATIMGAIMGPKPDATSLSDTLRDRNAAGPKMPDFSQLMSAIPATAAAFDAVAAAVGAFSSIVSAFAWPGVIAAFTWPQTIFDFAWPDALDDFDWHEWVPHLNWGSFIGSLFGGPAPGGSTTTTPSGGGAGKGQKPAIDDGTDRASSSFVMGASTAMVGTAAYGGGYGAGGGVVIQIDAVHVHNDMDIEMLAQRLARRFQQSIR